MIDSELAVLAAMPGSHAEIERRTGIKGRTVRGATQRLCLRNQAHVCGYQPRAKGGTPFPIFASGKGVSVQRIEPVTQSGLRRKEKKAQPIDSPIARAALAAWEGKPVRGPASWISPLLAA